MTSRYISFAAQTSLSPNPFSQEVQAIAPASLTPSELLSRSLSRPLTDKEEEQVTSLLMQRIKTVLDIASYSYTGCTPREQFLTDLINLMASQEWVEQDMDDFVSEIDEDTLKILNQERYWSQCTPEARARATGKWHRALSKFGYPGSSDAAAPKRHLVNLVTGRISERIERGTLQAGSEARDDVGSKPGDAD